MKLKFIKTQTERILKKVRESFSKDREYLESLPGEHRASFLFAFPFVIIYVFSVFLMRTQSLVLIFTAPLCLALLYKLCIVLYKALDRAQIKKNAAVNGKGWLIAAAGVLFFYALLIARRGVNSSPDTEFQFRQILTGEYSDWHPVMHTYTLYLFYKLTGCYTGIAFGFVLCFSLVCGWLCNTLLKYGYLKKTIVPLLLFIVISPVSMYLQRILWKDTAFAIAVLAISTALINILESKGKWLTCKRNLMFFGALIIYASFVRHNGIFLTIPLLVLLPFVHLSYYSGKRVLLFSFIVLLFLGGYTQGRGFLIQKGYITDIGNQKFSESVGVPMCMMCEVLVKTPDKMPPDAKEFMYRIVSQEEYEKLYDGTFNPVKFAQTSHWTDASAGITPLDFFKLFFKTAAAAPVQSLSSFRYITSLGWDPLWNYQKMIMYIPYSEFPENYKKHFIEILMGLFGWFFLAPGFWILVLIVFTGYAVRKIGWSACCIALPYIAYTAATSLLLCDRDHRFFYAILVGVPPIILSFAGTGKKTADQCREKQE